MQSVIIIGGGIGGLTLANALQQSNIPFQLYERSPVLSDVGAGIGLSEAPLKILGWLGLYESFRKVATKSEAVYMPDKHLNIRRSIKLASEAFCIHRARLIDVLIEKLPEKNIHLSKELTGIEVTENGTKLVFTDETVETSGSVVAADGIHSVIRKNLFPEISIRYINQVIWRGISPLAPPEPFNNGFFEIWDEGLRFLAIPINRTQTFWLCVDRAKPGGKDQPETIIQELTGLFRNFHPALLDIVRSSGPILRNDMGDLGTSPRPWFKHNVCFLGDAIHATTPNLAQGGCQAIEDAWCLTQCLKKYPGDRGFAYGKYQKLRSPKVMDIVSRSWMFGKAAHSRNPLFHYGFRALLTHTPDRFLRKQESFLNDLSYLKKVAVNSL